MSRRYREHPISPEASERRRQKLYVWPEALHRAHHGKTKALRECLEYLHRNGWLPDQDQHEELLDLIDRRIHRTAGRGRKPGLIPPPDPYALTAEHIAAYARAELEGMKQANGGRTPRGAVSKAINTWVERFADDGYLDVYNINLAEVRAIMLKRKRPSRSRKK
jgi:hypothetical protein